MAHESLRDKSIFGFRLSLADNIDSDGWSNTRLSVDSLNWDTETGYVQVLNLDEQLFYPKCTMFRTRANSTFSLFGIGNGYCDDFLSYNTRACGWDGGDCKVSDRKPVHGYPDCLVHYPEAIGNHDC
eukprot:338078_1